jgi:hypothetical protein
MHSSTNHQRKHFKTQIFLRKKLHNNLKTKISHVKIKVVDFPHVPINIDVACMETHPNVALKGIVSTHPHKRKKIPGNHQQQWRNVLGFRVYATKTPML